VAKVGDLVWLATTTAIGSPMNIQTIIVGTANAASTHTDVAGSRQFGEEPTAEWTATVTFIPLPPSILLNAATVIPTITPFAQLPTRAPRPAATAPMLYYIPNDDYVAPEELPSYDTVGCCKHCTTGQACGNSCISWNYTCHKPPGCACQ
jgi:hypothetical protein